MYDHSNHVYSNPRGQDPKVAKAEDALHPATRKTLDLSSLKLTEGFPNRPGYGTKGTKVELTANYVELLPPSNMTLHRYDIQISPEVVGRKRFRVVQLLLRSPEVAPHRDEVATDFRSTLISKTKFPRHETIIEIRYVSEGEDEPAARATTYTVRVLYTKTLSIVELINYLNSTNLNQSFGDKQELTQALNIFLNHFAKSEERLVTIGPKTFSLNQNAVRGDLGSGLEVIRGFFSSVRIATCRILVNINVSHGAFYQSGPLPALMNGYGVRNTAALEKFLKLLRVRTTHLPDKRNRANEIIPRVKTVFGLARKDDGHNMAHPPRVRDHGSGAKNVEFWIDGEASSSSTAKVGTKSTAKGRDKGKGKARPDSSAIAGSGKYISVFEFFKTSTLGFFLPYLTLCIANSDTAHGRVLQHPELPVVNCGNRENPMYLPAEVCIVLPGQSSKSKLDGTQTQQMIRHAVRKPWENANAIVTQGVQTVGLDENSNILMVCLS